MKTLASFIAFDAALRDCVSPMQIRAMESQLNDLAAACAKADRDASKHDLLVDGMRQTLARMAAQAHRPAAEVVPLHVVTQESAPSTGAVTSPHPPGEDGAGAAAGVSADGSAG